MRVNREIADSEVMRIPHMDVGASSRMLEENFPETWNRVHTKSIHAPGNYYSSKALAVAMTSTIEDQRLQLMQSPDTPLESNMGVVAGILEKYNFPLYYVSGPLVEAMKKSHPPAQMKWSDLQLPFPAMCFMIPRGSIVEPEPTKSEIAFLGVARVNSDTATIPCIGRVKILIPYNKVCVFWSVGPSCMESNDCTFPEDQSLEPSSSWIDEKTKERACRYGGPDGAFSSFISGLVANFILVMEARKELVETGKTLRPRNIREHKPELCSPTFIGRNYYIQRKYPKNSDPKSHFTELGWRAGHFKRQHFGSKREQEKTIFIDPYIAFVRGLVKSPDPVGAK